MKRISDSLVIVALVLFSAHSVRSQQVIPTPFFNSFYDSVSTFNGQLLVPGSIIEAYDIDGVLNGLDTVAIAGQYGFMPVYGDDNQSPTDEGALEGELIRFSINGRDATVTAGDATWNNQMNKRVSLAATSLIALSAVQLPQAVAAAPGDTVQFRARVRNDGDGLDFYGVNLTMSIPDDGTIFGWQAMEPDSVVYAAAGAEADVFFSIRVAIFSPDTVNTISYSIFSNLDPSVTVNGSVAIFMTLTDVDDDPTGLLPDRFALKQNYPNPFNPSTTISFELPAGSSVQLQVYDLLGRVVDDIDLGHRLAGSHRYLYDASHLSSGVYFYRVASPLGTDSRKMVLLK